MSQYILVLIWIGVLAALESFVNFSRQERVLGLPAQRYHPVFAFFLLLPVIWMAAVRGNIIDTGAYLRSYRELMPSSFSGLSAYEATLTKDKGFYLFSALIKIFTNGNEIMYLLIIALIQGSIIAFVFRKYSSQYIISIFLFIASTDYFSWMFNGIRQFMAVVFIFSATGFMLKKKWLPSVAAILLASTMHQSALIMLAVIIIVQGKAWNKKTILFLAIALVAVLFVERFTDILDAAMQETQYANMVNDWTEWNDDGTNFLRVAVYALPTFLSLAGLRHIRAANDPIINFCTNMSIVSTSLYIISMFTSGIFMGRLPIYVSLYNYILLPWELDHLFTKRSAQILKIVMVGAYLVFYYYQMHLTWGYL